MGKKRLVIYDDQILIDMDLLFKAIREAKGDWEKVEKEIGNFQEVIQSMGNDED